MNEYICEYTLTDRERRLYELASWYHADCELYDRIVCTGPVIDGSIMPNGYEELALVGRNALEVRRWIDIEARRDGFTKDEVSQAISKWKP